LIEIEFVFQLAKNKKQKDYYNLFAKKHKIQKTMSKMTRHSLQSFESGSACIGIDLALLDPHLYREYGCGFRSRSKEIDQN
jgi:hypothetical protein